MSDFYIVKKYYIIEKDFRTKKRTIVYQGPKIECFEMIESLSEGLVINLQGDSNIIKYYKPNDKNRLFGYFIQQDNTNDKLIVKRKYLLNGYIYNTVQIEKIKSFQIIEFEIIRYNFFNNYFLYESQYNNVMNQLRDSINYFDKFDVYNKIVNELKLFHGN